MQTTPVISVSARRDTSADPTNQFKSFYLTLGEKEGRVVKWFQFRFCLVLVSWFPLMQTCFSSYNPLLTLFNFYNEKYIYFKSDSDFFFIHFFLFIYLYISPLFQLNCIFLALYNKNCPKELLKDKPQSLHQDLIFSHKPVQITRIKQRGFD